MSKRLKLSALAFVSALALTAATAPAHGDILAQDVCRPKVCTIDGKVTVCCMIEPEGSMICLPCGGHGET